MTTKQKIRDLTIGAIFGLILIGSTLINQPQPQTTPPPIPPQTNTQTTNHLN